VTISKQRDGTQGRFANFVIQPHSVPAPEGEPINSAVIVQSGRDASADFAPRAMRRNTQPDKALAVLAELIDDAPVGDTDDVFGAAIPETKWRAALEAAKVIDGSDSESARKAFSKIKKRLDGYIELDAGDAALTESGRDWLERRQN
jgi:hypothetical protein